MKKGWLVDGDRSAPTFSLCDFFLLVIARQPPAPLEERMAGDKEIGCSVGFMQNCPADLHLPGFCGISADRAESGLDSQNFAFSPNSICGAIWGIFWVCH